VFNKLEQIIKFVSKKKLYKMEFKRKFGRQKKTKPTKGLFLVLVLAFVLILWFKAEDIMNALF